MNDRKPAYTLKIRGGCETYTKRDGSIGTAGKGPLVQVDKAATIGVTQDQYLFAPISHSDICLNDQGGSVMTVTYGKADTLRAQMHGHPPNVLEEVDCIDTQSVGCTE